MANANWPGWGATRFFFLFIEINLTLFSAGFQFVIFWVTV
jgi:hypothetical protein